MIVQILLAAGRGTRIGGNKAALLLAGTPVLTRLLDAAAASRVDLSVVVGGAEAGRVEPLCRRPRTTFVLNRDFDRGQTSSLQAGLAALPTETEAFLVHPVDHALVDAEVLDRLVDAFAAADPAARREAILRPTFGGGWGHPVLYAASYAAEFLALAPESSARVVYRRHLARVVGVPTRDDACLVDLDEPADLAAAERRLAGRLSGP